MPHGNFIRRPASYHWAEFLLYILNEDVCVFPKGKFTHDSAMALRAGHIYDGRCRSDIVERDARIPVNCSTCPRSSYRQGQLQLDARISEPCEIAST